MDSTADTNQDEGERLSQLLHDLRTPLNQIIGFSEMLIEIAAEEKRPDLSEGLATVREAGLELNQILHDKRRLSLTPSADDDFWPLTDSIRSPVSRIKAFLDLALASGPESELENFASDLEKIRAATESFYQQVRAAGLFIRIEEGRKSIPVHEVGWEPVLDAPRLSGRILIVDDEILNREILIRRLQREGCQPVGVRGGREALALLQVEKFDAVLLDIIMPEISGIDVLRSIKGNPGLRDLPVIMLSALTDVDRVARCIELGAEDYLPKPVNAILLRARLGACLEKKRLRDQDQANLRALHAEKERLSVTLRSLADAVIATDAEGRIELFNDVAATLSGLSAEQVIGWPFDQVFPIYQRADGCLAPNAAMVALDHNAVIDSAPGIAIRLADGSERLISTRSAPIHDHEGEITGTVVVLRDITEQEKMADELLRASKLQSIGVLAGGLAHDFNNMLTAVLGNLSLVRHRNNLPPELIPLTDEAERGALRARDLTQYLLTFAEGGAPMKETLHLGQLLEETAAFAMRGSNVHAEVDFPPDLWQIEADPNQVVQVVGNIVINAVQASAEGGNILVRAANITVPPALAANLPNGDYLRVSVQDWGVGIEPENLARIYDPFFTTKKQARGLGLAAAYSIIQRHGGQIEVHSVVGEGTTISFYLPAIRPVAAPAPTELMSPEILHLQQTPEVEQNKEKRPRVLVMDDEEPIRTLASAMLGILGYEVAAAADGEEAVALHAAALVSDHPFDYFVSDLTIPGGMGGRDAIRLIREKDQKITAIVSSGYSNDPVMAHYQDYGFNGVLPKPYMFSDLVSLMRQLNS